MNKALYIKSCILCNSTKLAQKELLKISDIISLYTTSFKFSVENYFLSRSEIEFVQCKNCKLKFFEPQFAGKSKFYEELQANRKVYYNPDRAEFNFAKQYIEEEDSVLEIGSGSGFFAKKISNKKYKGLEFNDRAIYDAKKKGIQLIKQSIEDYSNQNISKYDVVCSFHVLEHVKDPYIFIKDSLKTLKVGGKMIVSVPFDESPLTNSVNHVLNMPPHHISRWNKASLDEIAQIFNLDIVASKNHFVNDNIPFKHYFKELFLGKTLHLLYPKSRVLIDNNKLLMIKKYTNALVNKLSVHKLLNSNRMIGENITYIYKKRI
ncbi:MAG: class I SAM-dependent methyltransferase [Flavobacteriaceae bacterium]|nr:class I SAM-dependent methyltransferase [Flavobacteriaceae bacterium]